MCHGDISLIPMHWNPFSPIPEADFSVPHRCVNWKKLREWTRENSVDMMKPNFLQHPTLGMVDVKATMVIDQARSFVS